MGKRFVVTMLGALSCGTKTGEPTHNPPAPEPVLLPEPEPQPVPQPELAPQGSVASDGARELNGRDPQNRLIFKASDGSCYIQLPPPPPAPDAPPVSFRPMARETVDCPTSMQAAGWENCIGGRVLLPTDGAGECLCAVFGNPPPPPRRVACPKEEG